MSNTDNPWPNQRGSESHNSEPPFLVIGEITKPHGVRGEVRVFVHSDDPQRFKRLSTVYIGEDDPQPIQVEKARLQNGMAIVKFAGVDTREVAETLRGQLLQVAMDEAIPLQDNEYFLFQLLDLAVVTDEGQELGQLVEIIETGANNVFLVQSEHGEILVPDIPDVIQSIDFEQGKVIVKLLPGM